jgi:pyruvate formate lyase activating enzyme
MQQKSRRDFLKDCLIGSTIAGIGYLSVNDFILGHSTGKLKIGFTGDAPQTLWKWSKEAEHYERAGGMVRCNLCPHNCMLREMDRSFCRVRVVKNNKLYTIVYGNPCAVHIDPIEKKPLYHFLPETMIFSLATAGCNLRCLNCQNWDISQRKPEETLNFDIMPEQVVKIAQQNNTPSIAYTYSEPIIYYEYVKDTARIAKEQGIKNVLVTAGFINEKPLRELLKFIDAVTLDLKAFSNAFYKKITSALLEPVLKTIMTIKEEGVWLELSNLVVPTLSDSSEDIFKFCEWIVREIDSDQPLHFLRFYPAHKLQYLYPTPVGTLESAYKSAKSAGLKYVYIGNVPGHPAQNTYCPRCGKLLIEREGYIIKNYLIKENRCECGEKIPGVWKI